MNTKFYVVNWSDNSIEVLKASKVICLMKYKGETWKRIIDSIWGKYTTTVMFF